MKTFEIRKNSWHYALAEFSKVAYHLDICSYMRAVVWGLIVGFWLGFCAIVITVFGSGILVEGTLAIWFRVFHDLPMDTTGFIGVCLTVAAICGGICIVVSNMRYRSQFDPKPDGFIKIAYKSYKEKYCIRVTIKD